MTYRLRFESKQQCYHCNEETCDFGMVGNDDVLGNNQPLIYAVCRGCAIKSGLATDDEEWNDELRWSA